MRLGIDVGGTNTDAVIIDDSGNIKAWSKQLTTSNLGETIYETAKIVLNEANVKPESMKGVFLGTTHVLNELYYPKNLAKTALIRLTKKPSKIKPGLFWPSHLSKYIIKEFHLETKYDFTRQIPHYDEIDHESVFKMIKELEKAKVESVCIVGAFSSFYEDEENNLKKVIASHMPSLSVTVSNEIGSIGFLDRENASLLNSMLSFVMKDALSSINDIFKNLGLHCPYWITQNDGSLMKVEEAIKLPIFTIGSGITNSLRGASKLTGLKNFIGIDVGGSTIDIGMVSHGHPQTEEGPVKVLDIPVNVRLPKVHSLSTGGGNLVNTHNGDLLIEDTIASDITKDGLAWGGELWTISDSFLKIFPHSFKDKHIKYENLEGISTEDCLKVVNTVSSRIREKIRQLQPKDQYVPLVLVGGGSPLLLNNIFTKFDKAIQPVGYQICNAVGACYAPLSSSLDKVFWLNDRTKEEIVEREKERVITELIHKGAKPETIKINRVEEFPFDYLKGEMFRLKIMAFGDL
ncbi:hydantoinase/oxoprolinase [Cytobacillus sp. Sa5YUA1]|uniref:Hydantoinase/oxoprolinase n=1 Tax=Cytobacillus stercorigallinarum TaxID=2762240 RepID=A0ABR8QLM5_9BACI|nr:hydantoinase/oxoprolinase N-terminal domain-containing protein [Cytobacillus stercorigallinarum]MBD7936414.1 hydantoinase/oxoprolinase [Cytobacillus stercorigallinarum]